LGNVAVTGDNGGAGRVLVWNPEENRQNWMTQLEKGG